MRNVAVCVCLGLLAMSLPACSVCCPPQDKSAWQEGYQDIEWRTEDEEIEDLVVNCRNLYLIRYRRVDDDLVFRPAEEDSRAEPVDLYRLFYGFCDHEFFEVLVFADGSQYDRLVRIFQDYFGAPVAEKDGTTYWRRGDVAGQVKMAKNFFRKVEGRLTYIPLAQKYEGYANEARLVWVDSAVAAPVR